MTPRRLRAALTAGAVAVVTVCAAVPASAPAAAAPEPVRWLALGDSYASGLGAGALTAKRSAWGTDCGRATGEAPATAGTPGRGYPVVARDIVTKAGVPVRQDFVACTGRTTNTWAAQVAEAYRGQGVDVPVPADPELPPVRTSPTVRAIEAQARAGHRWDVVTVTFGGNNLQVIGFLTGCMDVQTEATGMTWASGGWGGCDIGEEAVQRQVDLLVGAARTDATNRMVQGDVPLWSATPTRGEVAPLFEALAPLVEPGGRVVVVGYPQVFADPATTAMSTAWPSGRATLEKIGTCSGAPYADVRRVRKGMAEVSKKIEGAVAAADAAWRDRGVRFDYLDATTGAYEKDGAAHGLCSPDPWMNGIGEDPIGPMHPDQDGQTAMGELVAEHVLGTLGRSGR